MKVLILSWYFPPSNTIGAIRVGKLAKYLMRRNVDVRVVTAREPDLSKTLPLEIPAERVTWTRAIDVNRPIDVVGNLRNRCFAAHQNRAAAPHPEHHPTARAADVPPCSAGCSPRSATIT